ncbi:MAG: helix-turn-helix transcriptional regulator [Thermoanaerobaculia bacterium]
MPGFVFTELRHRRPSKNGPHPHGPAYFSRLTTGSYREQDGAGDTTYPVGGVRFHPASYRHGDEIGSAGARFLCVELEDGTANDLAGLRRAAPRLSGPESEVARIVAAMGLEIRATDAAGDFVLEGLAFQLLGTFVRLPVEGGPPAWLRRVAEQIREESSRPLRLDWLAAAAGVHPVHLARSFRRHYGRSVGEELRWRRVEAIRRAISSEEVTLADAASQAGFADQSHMSRVFRRLTGMSPKEFRRIARGAAGEVREVPKG